MRKTVVNSSQAGVEGKCGKCAMRHLLISGYISSQPIEINWYVPNFWWIINEVGYSVILYIVIYNVKVENNLTTKGLKNRETYI